MKPNLFNIEGKVIVITGGCGVLGTDISHYLAGEGAKVAILDRNEARIGEVVSHIRSEGGDVHGFVTDVLDKKSLESVREQVLAVYGRVDVLLNAAGGNMPGATIGPDQTIFDLDIESIRKVVDLNLFGTLLPSIVFAKAMVENGEGNIVNFSSESALRPLTRVAGYGAAKAAVANFTKYMAGELAKKFGEKFRVNALVPGFFITEQNRTLLTNPDGTLTARGETIIAHTPFSRFGEPDELLGSIHYLISDASKFVSGTLLVVDGGFDAFSI